MSAPFDPRRFGKAARNEQRKLVASSINTFGLAALGIGFLTPLLGSGPLDQPRFKFAVVWAIFAVTHILAQRVLATTEE